MSSVCCFQNVSVQDVGFCVPSAHHSQWEHLAHRGLQGGGANPFSHYLVMSMRDRVEQDKEKKGSQKELVTEAVDS